MNNDQQESRSGARAGGTNEPPGDHGIAARTHEAAEQFKSAAEARATQVRQGIDSTKEVAAKRVRKLGVAIRAIGENMRIDDDQFVARYADSASRRLDSIATYLSDHDARDVMHDAEDLMRRQPALCFGGALMVGLVAGRFLGSSRPQAGAATATTTQREPSDQDSHTAEQPPSTRPVARDTARRPNDKDYGAERPRSGANREPRDPRKGAAT